MEASLEREHSSLPGRRTPNWKKHCSRSFCAKNYADYLLIDFASEGPEIRENFRANLNNLDEFFRLLFLLKGKSLPAGDAVIIFDEVQLFPLARQAIKALVKDGRYHYIETGSLISIKKNIRDILIPSEEYKIVMYPMDFEEFLWALGDSVTASAIHTAFSKKSPVGEAIHRKIMKTLRTYMVVGGMPQAVEAYVNGKDYEEIDFIKRSILNLYEEDLHRFDVEEKGRVGAIFKTLPEQLSSKKRQFRYALLGQGMRYHRLLDSLDFLAESMIVNLCTQVTVPDVMMELYTQQSTFKMFMADTGLLISQTSPKFDASLYKALIFGSSGANLGMIYENMAAQMLTANGHKLHFHEFKYQPEGKDKENSYEIDFVILQGKRICPIEVKSSAYKAHKSLDSFIAKYQMKIPNRYVLYTKDLHFENGVTYLPLYMAMCL
ncbi:ATP-binding protein [Arcanobacterium hippocoleae]|uniref:ATP-binding protein n=1 Tax=Arcanobacterium hippocoleae TaxID=149017 RepID=UPI00333E6CDD